MSIRKKWIVLALSMVLLTSCVGGANAISASPKCLRLYRQVYTPTKTYVPSTGCRAVSAPVKVVPQTQPQAQQPQTVTTNLSSAAAEVVAQVNAERAKQGLSALRVDAELTRAACVRAAEIVQKFSHTRPDGTAWSTVSASVYGENIAMGQRTADKVMAAWMTSEGHRANILRASYGSIGVCALVSDGVTYWVQLFGK